VVRADISFHAATFSLAKGFASRCDRRVSTERGPLPRKRRVSNSEIDADHDFLTEEPITMRRTQHASAVFTLLFALLGLGLGGCGESQKVDKIQVSPEAKQADEGAQKGMREFMESKGKTKPNAK
jgi:hypothetical protein